MVMRKITFSADRADIELARESAHRQDTTLDEPSPSGYEK